MGTLSVFLPTQVCSHLPDPLSDFIILRCVTRTTAASQSNFPHWSLKLHSLLLHVQFLYLQVHAQGLVCMHKIHYDHFYNLGSGRELCTHSKALSPRKTAKKHLILVIRGRFCEEPVESVPHPAWFAAGVSPWQLRPVMWEVSREWEQIPAGLHQPNSYLAKGCYSNPEPRKIQKLLQWLLKCLPAALRQDKENPSLWCGTVAHCHTFYISCIQALDFPNLLRNWWVTFPSTERCSSSFACNAKIELINLNTTQ